MRPTTIPLSPARTVAAMIASVAALVFVVLLVTAPAASAAEPHAIDPSSGECVPESSLPPGNYPPCDGRTWSFAVAKDLIDPDGLVGVDEAFGLTLTCLGDDEPHIDSGSVTAGDSTVFEDIPSGYVTCTVSENDIEIELPEGYSWNEPVYSPSHLVSSSDGCVTWTEDDPGVIYPSAVSAPCVTITNSYDAEIEIVPSASLVYECGTEAQVVLTSAGGVTGFVVLVDGEVHTETDVDGTQTVDLSIATSTRITVVAGDLADLDLAQLEPGAILLDEVVEREECVLGIEEEPTTTTTTIEAVDTEVDVEVQGSSVEASQILPRTGAGTSLLAAAGGLMMAAGVALRTATRRMG